MTEATETREIIGLTEWANTPLEYKVGQTRRRGAARVLRHNPETGGTELVPVLVVSDQEYAALQRWQPDDIVLLTDPPAPNPIRQRVREAEQALEDHTFGCPVCGQCEMDGTLEEAIPQLCPAGQVRARLVLDAQAEL